MLLNNVSICVLISDVTTSAGAKPVARRIWWLLQHGGAVLPEDVGHRPAYAGTSDDSDPGQGERAAQAFLVLPSDAWPWQHYAQHHAHARRGAPAKRAAGRPAA